MKEEDNNGTAGYNRRGHRGVHEAAGICLANNVWWIVVPTLWWITRARCERMTCQSVQPPVELPTGKTMETHEAKKKNGRGRDDRSASSCRGRGGCAMTFGPLGLAGRERERERERRTTRCGCGKPPLEIGLRPDSSSYVVSVRLCAESAHSFIRFSRLANCLDWLLERRCTVACSNHIG